MPNPPQPPVGANDPSGNSSGGGTGEADGQRESGGVGCGGPKGNALSQMLDEDPSERRRKCDHPECSQMATRGFILPRLCGMHRETRVRDRLIDGRCGQIDTGRQTDRQTAQRQEQIDTDRGEGKGFCF